jgi:hypothetical protein
MDLHRAFDPDSEHIAMLGYQAGTLQYVMGKYQEAGECGVVFARAQAGGGWVETQLRDELPSHWKLC